MIVFKTIFPNGKIYIGQTIFNRSYYFGSGKIVSLAIKKYGKQNLKKEILKTCKNQKQLDVWERIYIKKFDSRNPEIGYNIYKGGNGHSERVRVESGKLKSGNKHWLFGKKHSNKTKKKISETKKSNPIKFWKGKIMSKEHREKLSLAKIGKAHSKEHNIKKGKKHSFEWKNKISKAVKLNWDLRKAA